MSPVTRLALVWLALASPLCAAAELTLAVAANFTAANRELVQTFTAASDHRVRSSYGATGKLYAQIVHGAPFEVLLAADTERPARLEAEGLAVAGSRFTYARGGLVLWSARAGQQLGTHSLDQDPTARIAIANPATAPYGLAARQVLRALGRWEALQPRLVRGESIAQTFQFVATGNAALGLVARAQLRTPGIQGTGSVWEVPAGLHAPIEQQAVLLRRGEANPAARDWLAFLRSDAARAIIEAHGYAVPAAN